MATLYELDKAINQVIETGFAFDEETGEILFDESDLDALNVAFEEKLENCGLWIKNQKALAAAIREEEKALAERRKALEARVERMEGYVLHHIQNLPKPTVETPRLRLSTRKSTVTIIENEELVPDELCNIVTTRKPLKTEIAKALKNGTEVQGAKLVERKTLQIK